MYSYFTGGKSGKRHNLEISNEYIVVRTRSGKQLEEAVVSDDGLDALNNSTTAIEFSNADVYVLKGKPGSGMRERTERNRQTLKKEKRLQFAGRVLQRVEGGPPVVYTENLLVKFKSTLKETTCEKILEKNGLEIKKPLAYAKNYYFVSAAEGTGLAVFDIAQKLLDNPKIELCQPELVHERKKRAIAPQQWHLATTVISGVKIDSNINVSPAWKITRGNGVVIAVIDDGVDIDHEEFRHSGKIVAPRDVTENTDDPRPKDYGGHTDDHGTACAGVACASGHYSASGVAPESRLMPIRLVSGLGSQDEAEAIYWAAENGADVISCSWGPPDGNWWDPYDPNHMYPFDLPDSTRLAIEWAIEHGRGGKGCVITWAAGNGGESADMDGYASYEKVIAVAACNDTAKRSIYSDYGFSVWCCFPSNDFGQAVYTEFPSDDAQYELKKHPQPLTKGIWTTDRTGMNGYNPGNLDPTASPPGNGHGNYTSEFGGTSSACPGIAGIAALIISANSELDWEEVKDVIRQACEMIDVENGDYDERNHSYYYGYGKPDAETAVKLALQLAN